MTDKIIIKELFENALKDPSLLSNLDVKKLLESLENRKNDYLENKTIDSVIKEIYDNLNKLKLSEEKIKNYCKILQEYRFVDNISELHIGKHIKCIRTDKKKDDVKMFGGIVISINFKDNGTYIVIRNQINNYFKFYQLKYDNFLIFQKMTLHENLILLAQGTVGSMN
jgi:hypothetical protein